MEPNIFSPKIQSLEKDKLAASLKSLSQGILVLVFALLPIFFIPGVFTSLGLMKVYMVVIGVFSAIVFLSLSILRSGSIAVVVPPALAFYWLFTVIAIASAFLSGDTQDALYGNAIEVHTAGFLVLLGLVMTISMSFGSSKAAITRLFIALGISALLLQLVHVFRLFFGPDFLSFGVFNSPTVSVLGSFNDLAIFSGLVTLITLIVVQQMFLTTLNKILSGVLVASSLILLSIINFYAVWLTIGFISLLMFLYLISKDTWMKGAEEDSIPTSKFVLALVGVVCLFSAIFVISGDLVGNAISRATNISYLEIRPSVGATIDITKSVISENALLGVGPNRFEDAWRQYKNPVINQTAFWNTNFSAGSGYVPTLFVTTGIAGGASFVLFLLAFLYLGYRTLFSVKVKDAGWYLVGTITFISALYLWLMAIIYVPGVTILLLTALMTGISFAVYLSNNSSTGVVIDVTSNKQYGLLLIAAVLLVIIASTLSVISVSKQFLANVNYANTVIAFQSGSSVIEVDQKLSISQDLNNQDLFVSERAQLRFTELVTLNSQDPADVDQQRYTGLLSEGISLAEQAILLDSTNPANYILLSNFYGLLDPAQFDGIRERTESMFNRARELDPTNPSYLVFRAQYMARIGDLESTRKDLLEAISIKNNYTDALFLLSQLDIQEGNTESAIAVTRSIISIEPNNPTRYFQLGILEATNNNLEAAIKAFETAVGLDNNYANARYFLALAYLDTDRKDDALVQLRIVEESNPDSELIKNSIQQIESGDYQRPQSSNQLPVQSGEVVSQNEDVTTTSEVPNTDLVSPLNNSLPASGSQSTSQNENNVAEPAQ
jgi:tetratricopeptide (TPR) repeat protein